MSNKDVDAHLGETIKDGVPKDPNVGQHWMRFIKLKRVDFSLATKTVLSIQNTFSHGIIRQIWCHFKGKSKRLRVREYPSVHALVLREVLSRPTSVPFRRLLSDVRNVLEVLM